MLTYEPVQDLTMMTERILRAHISEVAGKKYGTQLCRGMIDLYGNLPDGRVLRIEHEYMRSDPVANITKAWAHAFLHRQTSTKSVGFVLIHIFYAPNYCRLDGEWRSSYNNAIFTGEQMVHWARNAQLSIQYYPFAYFEPVEIETELPELF